MYFVAYKQIHFLPKPKDAVPLRPNLLEGTDFGRNLAAWTRRIGQVVSVSGEPQRAFRLDGRGGSQAYEVGLEQPLDAKLKPDTLYALSFDLLAGQDVAAAVYVGAAQPTGETGALKGWASWWSGAGVSVVVARADAKGRCEVWFRSAKSSGELLRIEWRNYSPGYAMLHRPKLEEIADADLRPSAWCLAEADKIGQQGERGAAIRGPQLWADFPDDYPFQSGGEGEDYHDIVIHQQGEQQFYYACTQSHTKAPDRAPAADSPHWAQTQRQELVATRLLLADKALIRNLVVEELYSRDHSRGVYTLVAGGDFQIGRVVDADTPAETLQPNFRIGLGTDGQAVLQYLNKAGEVVGVIDEQFFRQSAGVSDTWVVEEIVAIAESDYRAARDDFNAPPAVGTSEPFKAQTFYEGYAKSGAVIRYNISQNSLPSPHHKRAFRRQPSSWQSAERLTGYFRLLMPVDTNAFAQSWLGSTHSSGECLPAGTAVFEYRHYVDGVLQQPVKRVRRKL